MSLDQHDRNIVLMIVLSVLVGATCWVIILLLIFGFPS